MTYKQIILNRINMKAKHRAEQILEEISGKNYFFLYEKETATEMDDDSVSFDLTAEGAGHIFRVHGYVDKYGDVNVCVIWLERGEYNSRLIWDTVSGVNEKEASYIKAIA